MSVRFPLCRDGEERRRGVAASRMGKGYPSNPPFPKLSKRLFGAFLDNPHPSASLSPFPSMLNW